MKDLRASYILLVIGSTHFQAEFLKTGECVS